MDVWNFEIILIEIIFIISINDSQLIIACLNEILKVILSDFIIYIGFLINRSLYKLSYR